MIRASEASSPLPEAPANFSKDVTLNVTNVTSCLTFVKHDVTFVLAHLFTSAAKQADLCVVEST